MRTLNIHFPLLASKLTLALILLLMGIFVGNQANAQEYKLAAGVRLGYPLSASVKYFISEGNALEAYVGTRGYTGYRWTNISGAYLVHRPLDIDGLEGLNWYAGAGLSIYFWSFDFAVDNFSTSSVGIQGYGGLEYVFEDIPLSISVDWIPTFFVGSGSYLSGFGGGYGTLGVRYVISD